MGAWMAQAKPAGNEVPAEWRQRLRETVLPSVADATTWQKLLDSQDDLDSLHQGIAADLPLALSVLSAACRSPAVAANLSGLHHALRMFGSQAVVKQLQRDQSERLAPDRAAHHRVLQALADSRLACLIHARWMLFAAAADAEQRFWITALLGVARWKLPLIDPELSVALDRRIAAGERRAQAERALLGVSIDQLNRVHLQDLGFTAAADLAQRMSLPPDLILASARLAREDQRPLSPPPSLARRLREPMLSCRLAYALALEAQTDWHSSRTALLLRVAATCFNRSVSSLRHDLERAALQASSETLYVRGLLAPAARMIRIAHPQRRQRTPVVEESATPISSASAASAAPATPRLARPAPRRADFVSRCAQHDFSSADEFLNAAAQHLERQGIGRCALLLKLRNPERIGVYFAHGFTDSKAARAVQFPPDQAGLLKGLLANPLGALLILPEQLASLHGKLPPLIENWRPTGGLLLATVAVNAAPVGLWWAEPAAPHSADPQQFAAFRQMMHGFGAEFTRLLRLQSAARRTPLRPDTSG